MKKLILLLFLTVLALNNTQAQTNDANYLQKVQSLDSTLYNLYAVISGEKGVKRDWELFKYLFHADAKLIPSGKNQEGIIGARFMSPDGYVSTAGKYLEENGFFEKEIYRKVDTFGNITQVFSTYESYHSEKDAEPFARGVNSIQLLHDGSRYWIINIYWMAETPEHPLPAEYLPH